MKMLATAVLWLALVLTAGLLLGGCVTFQFCHGADVPIVNGRAMPCLPNR